MRLSAAIAIAALAAALPAHADLKRALAEPNLEKRSRLALENARTAYQAARDAVQKNDLNQLKTSAQELQDSVDLAYQSLEQTGKNARSSPRYFKSAEQETSDLARRLDSLQQDLDYQDRPLLDKVKARVQEVHDNLLLQLVEGKKK